MNEKLFKKLNESIELHNIASEADGDRLSAEAVIFHGEGLLETIIPGAEKASTIKESANGESDPLDDAILNECVSLTEKFGRFAVRKSIRNYDQAKSGVGASNNGVKAAKSAYESGRAAELQHQKSAYDLELARGDASQGRSVNVDSNGRYIETKSQSDALNNSVDSSKKVQKLKSGVSDAEAAHKAAIAAASKAAKIKNLTIKNNDAIHNLWNQKHTSKFMKIIGNMFYGNPHADSPKKPVVSTEAKPEPKQNKISLFDRIKTGIRNITASGRAKNAAEAVMRGGSKPLAAEKAAPAKKPAAATPAPKTSKDASSQHPDATKPAPIPVIIKPAPAADPVKDAKDNPDPAHPEAKAEDAKSKSAK